MYKSYQPFLEAIVELFHPFVEVAVHDLVKGKLVAIYNPISQRKVGEPSPLKELKVKIADFPPVFAPYYKQNWDGRSLKCSSITLRNAKGKPIGLICINVDVSHFQAIETFLKIKAEAENPIEIHGTQFEKQANQLIQKYLKANRLTRLNREQKKKLVQELYRKGIFNFKNAIPFVSKKLTVSRASIYNYIREIGDL